MSRQQRRKRNRVPNVVHEDRAAWLNELFGEPVQVVRDAAGRWGVVGAGEVLWLGTISEVRSFDIMRQRFNDLGIRTGTPFPPGFGRWLYAALRWTHQDQRRRQHT